MLGDLQLGVWCGGSRDSAMQAGQDGADYVAFGPFSGGDDAADVELLSWWVELMELPAVAEGGITLANCGTLVAAGADFLAVDDAIWQHLPGPGAAVDSPATTRQHQARRSPSSSSPTPWSSSGDWSGSYEAGT